MQTFKIPVSWSVCGEVYVEAETIEAAVAEFDRREKGESEEDEFSLPTESHYIEDSFERDDDIEFIKMYNEETIKP